MKITPETKLKDLELPDGYEFDYDKEYSCEYYNSLMHTVRLPVKKKQKILEDYERYLLALQMDGDFYQWIKDEEPRLYWLKILEVIADDICEEEINRTWYIYKDNCLKKQHSIKFAMYSEYKNLGNIYFDTEKHARQAVMIMGNNIYKLF